MASSAITEAVAPVVSHLWAFVAGCAIAIVVGFVLTKLIKMKSRDARRATFTALTFLGLCISWYVVFARVAH
jgi:hypothetical protein